MFLSFLFLSCSNKSETQIVYADVNRIYKEFDYTKELNKELDSKTTKLRSTLDSLALNVQFYVDSLEQFKSGSKAFQNIYSQGRKAEELFKKKQKDFENYTSEKLATSRKDVDKKLNIYLKEFGDKNNYDFILGASGNNTMLYAKTSVDITDEMIEYANKRFQGE